MPAKEVKRRRGTRTQNNAFAGADGEITIDSTKNRARVHDAIRTGGYELLNSDDIQGQAGVLGAVSGTANAIVLTNDPVCRSLTNLRVRFKATADNTNATTVTVDGLTTKNIYKFSGGTLVALSGGEIKTGLIYELNYDGTQFQLGLGGASGGIVVKHRIYTSSTTYFPDPNLIAAIAEIVGGGGGGSGSLGFGGGGGAGGYSRRALTPAQIGASQTVTIGGGGGGATSTAGGNGGTTSLGSLLSATGGTGGGGSNTSDGGRGAGGGTGSSGDININGGGGGSGINNAAGVPSNAYCIGGTGGNSYFGAGGTGGFLNNPSSGGAGGGSGQYGGGGGGAAGTAGSPTGGNGGNGLCIITEFCSS